MSFQAMFIGQIRQMDAPQKEEPSTTQKPPEEQKSPTSTTFLQSAEARQFVEKWAPTFTKRGVNDLLSELHGGATSDKAALKTAERILLKLGNKDGLQNFLGRLKAKPEGIIKAIKSILG
jgi:hypothetical protein